MRVATRYALYQLPGYAAGAAVLGYAWYAGALPTWVAVALFATWVLKDVVLYPLVRSAYRREPDAARRLDGVRGIAVTTLAPRGLVRIGHETFRAEAAPDTDGPIPEGAEIVVTGGRGLLLVVARSAP